MLILTDELIDHLAEEYLSKSDKGNMTFIQFVEKNMGL